MPTDRNRNNKPKPRNVAANKLINSSLKTSVLLLTPFGRETTKTKNHDVKNVPIINKIVAKCGNIDGLMGDTYRVSDSILRLKSNSFTLSICKNLISKLSFVTYNLIDETVVGN